MDEQTKNTSDCPAPEGATTDLPHDRITVERFRQAFPRARWSDRLNAWFVPGRTAERRIGRWLAEMEAEADRFADEKADCLNSNSSVEDTAVDKQNDREEVRS